MKVAQLIAFSLLSLVAAETRPLPAAMVKIEIQGDYRVITSNGIPNHPAGDFPNRHNPNSIAAQDYHFRIPLHPTTLPSPVTYDHHPFGVAMNGIVFDPATAEFWNDDRSSGWNMEAIGTASHPAIRNLGLDAAAAHVQPNGAYHYHSIPLYLLKSLGGADGKKMTLLGWAADGFPIYGPFAYSDSNNSQSKLKEMRSSYRVKEGTRSSGPRGEFTGVYTADWEYVAATGDLDECNGRTGVTPEFPDGTYYYVLTADFPFIPREYKGKPDSSFERRGPRGRGPGGPGGPPPPRFGP